jgi:hypothetical protein
MPHGAREEALELETSVRVLTVTGVLERLERHEDGKLLIPGFVHLTHASPAEQPRDPVALGHLLARGESRRLRARQPAQPRRRRFRELRAPLACVQEGEGFLLEFDVVAASGCEEDSPLPLGLAQRLFDE